MSTLLLLIIYTAFIGLGLPDSLFGAAWSAIWPEFGTGLASASYVTVLVSGCTVISSLLSSRILARFSTVTVTAVSTAMTAAALLGYSLSPSLWCMCLFAIVLGLGAGAVDAALNDYISLHYSAMHMNFLHCFYGVGVVVSPYIMSAMLRTASWREGYRTVFFIQSGIALLLFLSFPLWKKVQHAAAQAMEELPRRVLKFSEMAKIPSVRLGWAVCVATNAVEAVCGIWGSSFLVLVHGLDAAAAAGAILFYYLGLALGRFLSGLLSVKLSPWRIIAVCTGILLCAVVLLFVPVPAVAIAGLFLAGLGNGPIYPNIMYLTPQHFGADVSASVMGSQMAFAYGGFMAAPPLFGILAEHIGAQLLPVYTLVWCMLLVVFTVLFRQKLQQKTAC